MSAPFSIEPTVGDWYESYGELFEVVAVDEDEGIVEVQYADGTLAALDAEDWAARCQAGAIDVSEPPENLGASLDADLDRDDNVRWVGNDYGEDGGLRASGIDDLDLFE